MRRAFAGLAAMVSAASPLHAQQTSLDARTAQAIVAGCAAHAAVKQQGHAIAVVDVGGHLVAALRMDGNGSGIMDFSLAKAHAVAAWGFPTAQMEDAAKQTPGFRPRAARRDGSWRGASLVRGRQGAAGCRRSLG